MSYPLVAAGFREPSTLAAHLLSGPAEVVRATEELARPRPWAALLRIGLSVSATAALMWTVGLTLILGCVLLFWAVLCALGAVLWWRETRNIEAAPQASLHPLAQTC